MSKMRVFFGMLAIILGIILMIFSIYVFCHMETAHEAKFEILKIIEIETEKDWTLSFVLMFSSGFVLFLLGYVLLFPIEMYKLIGKIKKLK